VNRGSLNCAPGVPDGKCVEGQAAVGSTVTESPSAVSLNLS
jgi:hypothetical protein